MCTRRRWLGISICALVVVGCEAAKRDPLPILRATAKAYSGLRSYYVAETTVLTLSDGSPPRTSESVIAAAPDGKSRYEMGTPAGKAIGVSDGKTEWIYFPAANQYQEGGAGSLPFASLGRTFMSSYSAIDEGIEVATWLRRESVTVGAESHICDVIRVVERPRRPVVENPEADRLWRTEWQGASKTYWIDRRHRVLRELSISSKGGRLETSVNVIRMDEDLASDLFVSPVPPGATKAHSPG